MAKAKTNKIESFLTANPKLDKTSSSLLVRKCDAKDENPNAETFLAFDTNESSTLLDFIRTFKNNLFTEIKKDYGKFVGKNFLVQILLETTLLDDSKSVVKAKTNLQKKFKTEIDNVQFLNALKTCFEKRQTRTKESQDNKLANMSDKAKAKYTGKEKQDLIVFLTKEKKAEKGKAQNA